MTQAQELAAVLAKSTASATGLRIADSHGDSLTLAGTDRGDDRGQSQRDQVRLRPRTFAQSRAISGLTGDWPGSTAPALPAGGSGGGTATR